MWKTIFVPAQFCPKWQWPSFHNPSYIIHDLSSSLDYLKAYSIICNCFQWYRVFYRQYCGKRTNAMFWTFSPFVSVFKNLLQQRSQKVSIKTIYGKRLTFYINICWNSRELIQTSLCVYVIIISLDILDCLLFWMHIILYYI